MCLLLGTSASQMKHIAETLHDAGLGDSLGTLKCNGGVENVGPEDLQIFLK